MSPVLVSYGGGTNSTAMLIGMAERGEVPDAILFADTGGEKPATYRYLGIMQDWCGRVGFPAIEVVRYTNRRGEFVSLEADCLRKMQLPSKAMGRPGCSLKWKVEPQEKWANRWSVARATWKAGGKVVKVLGFDADEPERVDRRAHADAIDPKYVYRYPLVEWGWGREECVEAILATGLPLPGKSACFFCPSTKKPELLRLHDAHPDLTARAVAMEERAIANDGSTFVQVRVDGLGRHWNWGKYLRADANQRKLFAPDFADPTDCGCYDGDGCAAEAAK